MADFTVLVESRAVSEALRELLERGQDMRPVYNAIGQEMENRIAARFETKTDPGGHPWAPWKPSTVAKYDKADTVKRRGGKTEVVREGSLLERKGRMLNSLNHQVEADGVRIGFGRPYAFYHETGTKHMERRGLIADAPGRMGAEDERAVLDLVRSYFLQTD